MGSPLRIFFFSDWRVQSLELAEELIRSVAPVDIIVYGGDDVVRFVLPPEAPAMLTVASRTYFPESLIPPDELSDVLFAISEQCGLLVGGEQSVGIHVEERRIAQQSLDDVASRDRRPVLVDERLAVSRTSK